MEIQSLCEKAPVKTDTQIEQFGNFVKNGGTGPVNFEIDFPRFCNGCRLK